MQNIKHLESLEPPFWAGAFVDHGWFVWRTTGRGEPPVLAVNGSNESSPKARRSFDRAFNAKQSKEGIPIKKKIDSYHINKNVFPIKKHKVVSNRKLPLLLWSWPAGSLIAWSFAPFVLVPWSSGPLVLWSLGRLVPWSPGPWSSHPLVLRPGLRVLGSALSRQGAFKVIWKSGHTSCEAL